MPTVIENLARIQGRNTLYELAISHPSGQNVLLCYSGRSGRASILKIVREIPVGTAEKYMIDAVARLQSAGLGSESETDDVIPLDRQVFPGGGNEGGDIADWFTNVNA